MYFEPKNANVAYFDLARRTSSDDAYYMEKACEWDDLATVKRVLEANFTPDKMAFRAILKPTLEVALQHSTGDHTILRHLFKEMGMDVNRRDLEGKAGSTPMHVVVLHNRQADTIAFLLAMGAKTRLKNKKGQTPLALFEYLKKVRRLYSGCAHTGPIVRKLLRVPPLESLKEWCAEMILGEVGLGADIFGQDMHDARARVAMLGLPDKLVRYLVDEDNKLAYVYG